MNIVNQNQINIQDGLKRAYTVFLARTGFKTVLQIWSNITSAQRVKVPDGDCIQISEVRTEPTAGGRQAFRLDDKFTNPQCKRKVARYETSHNASDLDGFFVMT
jgi:UDP-3-O-acyl-N-acetylglucosamine deacetylase